MAYVDAMTNQQSEFLTLDQYAEAIGKSRRTVQRWLTEGRIVSDAKLPGSTGAHLFLASRVEHDKDAA